MMKKILFSLIVMTALGCTMAFGTNYTKRPDWMKNLDSNTPVCRLCIPGVHDGGTGRVHVYGSSVQTLGIDDLFDCGVRAFDLRVGFTSGIAIKIFHGGLDMSYEFSNVMDRLYKKLDDHKKEFVILIIGVENLTTNKGYCMNKLRTYFIQSWDDPERTNPVLGDSEIFWTDKKAYDKAKAKWAVFHPGMTVEEARGKVILMFRSDYTSVEEMPGVMLPGFSTRPEMCTYKYYNGTTVMTSKILIQDAYHNEINGNDIYVKFKDYVVPTLDMITRETLDHPDDYVWCINHLSGYTNHACLPNSAYLAHYTNRSFNSYLAKNPELYTGIVMMDYAAETTSWGYNVAGSLALDAVIHQNHRYWVPDSDHRKHYEPNSN